MDTDKATQVPKEWKDPKFEYTWVLDEVKTRTVYQLEGYEAVTATSKEGQKFKEAGDPRIAQDGNIRVGDVLLMRFPVEKKRAREKEAMARQRGAIPSIKQGFHAEAAHLGIQSFEDESKP